MILEDQAVPKFYKRFRDFTKISTAQLKGSKTAPVAISQRYGPKYYPIVRHVHVKKLAGSVAYVANGNAVINIGMSVFTPVLTLPISILTTTVEAIAQWYGVGAQPSDVWTADTISNDNWASNFYWTLSLPTADLVTGDGDVEVCLLGDLIPKFPVL